MIPAGAGEWNVSGARRGWSPQRRQKGPRFPNRWTSYASPAHRAHRKVRGKLRQERVCWSNLQTRSFLLCSRLRDEYKSSTIDSPSIESPWQRSPTQSCQIGAVCSITAAVSCHILSYLGTISATPDFLRHQYLAKKMIRDGNNE